MKFPGETEGKNTLSLAPHIYTQRCVKQIEPWIKQYTVFTENHFSAKVNNYNNSKYHLLNAYFVPDTLITLSGLSHSVLTTSMLDRYYHLIL